MRLSLPIKALIMGVGLWWSLGGQVTIQVKLKSPSLELKGQEEVPAEEAPVTATEQPLFTTNQKTAKASLRKELPPITSTQTDTSTKTLPSTTAPNNDDGLPIDPIQADWRGKPQERIGVPLVHKGYVGFVDSSKAVFQKHLDEFISIYKNRPDQDNKCGMRINHSYALILAIKALQPTTIIENGVNAGHSTYLMRAAAGPDTKIYSIDPNPKPICRQKERWIDPNPSTVYLTGDSFQDFADIDWLSKIQNKEIDVERTIVFIDDHQNPFNRYPTLLKCGFKHILWEDNYKARWGATDGDKKQWLPKQIFSDVAPDRRKAGAEFMWNNTQRYAEFKPLLTVYDFHASPQTKRNPPLFGGRLHRFDDARYLTQPMLRPKRDDGDRVIFQKLCRELGMNETLSSERDWDEFMSYNQFTYHELVENPQQWLCELGGKRACKQR